MNGAFHVREARADDDLAAWIEVRRAVLPDESAGTVPDLRERARPGRLLLVAEIDGAVIGSGIADRADSGDRIFLAPRVVPAARRQGVGTAILRELAAHAGANAPEAVAHVSDEGSQAFAERWGFHEADRQVEQVIDLDAAVAVSSLPDGVEVTTVEARPELLRAAYPLAEEGYADLATDAPTRVPLDDWLRDEATLAGGSFVALHDGEVIGYSGLMAHDLPATAEDGLTVVRRDWRGHGLARALKQRELAWAAKHGYRSVITWTQRGNQAMRSLNEQLGYRYRSVSVTMVAPLPLAIDAR